MTKRILRMACALTIAAAVGCETMDSARDDLFGTEPTPDTKYQSATGVGIPTPPPDSQPAKMR